MIMKGDDVVKIFKYLCEEIMKIINVGRGQTISSLYPKCLSRRLRSQNFAGQSVVGIGLHLVIDKDPN